MQSKIHKSVVLLGFLIVSFFVSGFGGQQILPGILNPSASSGTPGTASHVADCSNSTGGGASSLACTINGVTAGDLIAGCTTWNDSVNNFANVSVSDGTSSFTVSTANSSGTYTTSTYGQCFYLLSANGGNKTYTVTYNDMNPHYGEIIVGQFHATSGTWHYDTQVSGTGNSTSSSSGNFTTHASTGEVVINGNRLANVAATSSSPSIGGNTPTEFANSPIGSDHQYYLLNTSVSAGAATLTYSATTYWTNLVVGFYAQ
jgi:hypothetical protein